MARAAVHLPRTMPATRSPACLRRCAPLARRAGRVHERAAALAMTFGGHLAVSVRGIACAPPGC